MPVEPGRDTPVDSLHRRLQRLHLPPGELWRYTRGREILVISFGSIYKAPDCSGEPTDVRVICDVFPQMAANPVCRVLWRLEPHRDTEGNGPANTVDDLVLVCRQERHDLADELQRIQQISSDSQLRSELVARTWLAWDRIQRKEAAGGR